MGPTKRSGLFLHDQKQMNEISCSGFLSRVSFLTRPRCSSAFLLGHVVSPCLSSSSDEHHCSHSCLGTGLAVWNRKQLCHYRASLVHLSPRQCFLCSCWCIGGSSVTILPLLEQNCSDLRNRDNYWFVCVLGTGYSITILCFFCLRF